MLSYQNPGKKLDLKSFGRKVQWNLSIEDKEHNLRAYLAAHTASLNMRLTTLGLTTISMAEIKAAERYRGLRTELQHQANIIQDNAGAAETIYNIVSGQVLPRLDSLIRLVERVWISVLPMLDYFTNIQGSSKAIDLEHTSRILLKEPNMQQPSFGGFVRMSTLLPKVSLDFSVLTYM